MAEGTQINYEHIDGRQCFHEGKVWVTYRNGLRFLCAWEHPPLEERKVNIDGPDPVRLTPTPEPEMSDRGEFGMPTLGDPSIDSLGQVWAAPGQGFRFRESSAKLTITAEGLTIDYGENGNVVPAETEDARYILSKVLPGLLERFLRKNAKYRLAQKHDLGVKGIVPDVNRKSSVIISRLWEGDVSNDEDTEEVIDDLIGHLLLMRAKMRAKGRN